MARILFVHNAPTSFVEIDRVILAERHAVTDWRVGTPWEAVRAARARVKGHDLVVGWFASWHTLGAMTAARWMGVPSLLIIGGYDVANLPEVGYGHQRGGTKRAVSRWTIRQAARLMTNSYFSQREITENLALPPERITVVYHGVPDPFGVLPDPDREPLVLTVGGVWRENLGRKGLEVFVRAAQRVPEARFVLVGKWHDDAADYLRALAPTNVLLTGFVDTPTLLDYYRRASVYVQASAHEGFGMSVAEAMLAGCIPVVTRAGALPEVVGDTGVVAAAATPEAVAAAIREALRCPATERAEARTRIRTRFPLAVRRDGLLALVDKCLDGLKR